MDLRCEFLNSPSYWCVLIKCCDPSSSGIVHCLQVVEREVFSEMNQDRIVGYWVSAEETCYKSVRQMSVFMNACKMYKLWVRETFSQSRKTALNMYSHIPRGHHCMSHRNCDTLVKLSLMKYFVSALSGRYVWQAGLSKLWLCVTIDMYQFSISSVKWIGRDIESV